MPRRPPIRDSADDIALVKDVLQLAYPGQEWDERGVDAVLAETKNQVHVIDPDRRAYCHLIIIDRKEPRGILPAGRSVQVATLAPQHHDQEWVNTVLGPLLNHAFRKLVRENRGIRGLPAHAYLSKDLIPYWTAVFEADVVPRSTGAYLMLVRTIREGFERLARLEALGTGL